VPLHSIGHVADDVAHEVAAVQRPTTAGNPPMSSISVNP
jgi:hypothetical protein